MILHQRNTSRLEGHRSGNLDPDEGLEAGGSVDEAQDVVHLGCNREGRHSEGPAQVVDAIFDEVRAADHGQGWDSDHRMAGVVLSYAGAVGYVTGGAETDCEEVDRPCLGEAAVGEDVCLVDQGIDGDHSS